MAEQPTPMQAGEMNATGASTEQHLPYWTGKGYCRQPDGYEIKKIELNLPFPQDENAVANMGRLVTRSAANNMFKDYVDTVVDLLKLYPGDPEGIKTALTKLISTRVIFGKEALLFLLAQPKCEGIRFYSCLKINQTNPTTSLILVGVDEQRNDLGDSLSFNSQKGYNSIIDDTEGARNPDSINVDRQSTAIFEVGGTDNLRFGNDALRENTIVSLEDELLARSGK